MRAVVADRYGGPEVLELRDVPEPKVGPDSVLVEVTAASINPVDRVIVEGALDGAFETVFPLIPGWDVAGTVVAVGPAVRHVTEGQPVFGYVREDVIGFGTWADRVAVNARAIAAAPASLDLVASACLPLAGLTAYQSLVEFLDLQPHETVVIHGASGGVGHLAVQIAHARGARVIGTASEPNHDLVRDLGGEPVAYGDGLTDRLRELAGDGVDAVFDLAGPEALHASAPLVHDARRTVSAVDPVTVTQLGGSYVFVRPDVRQLDALATLADTGDLAPAIEAAHPLEEVTTAVEQQARGVRGKVVLTMTDQG